MKRKILALITCTSIAVMALSACGGTANETSTDNVQEEAQTVASEGITEETSTVEETTTEAVETVYLLSKITFYDENDDVESIFEYEYDDAGNELSRIIYEADGTKQSESVNEYDSNGNLIKTFDILEDGTKELQEEKEYYEDGTIKKETSYEYGIESWISEYDQNGNETYSLMTFFDDDGNVDDKIEYEYDSGKVIKTTFYLSDGSISSFYEYEYDSNGNEISEVVYDPDGNMKYNHTHEYDNNNVCIKEAWYRPDGGANAIYEYAPDGSWEKETHYYTDGSLWYQNEYKYEKEYDSNDNITKNVKYSKDETSDEEYEKEYEYLFEYDANGNTTKETYYDGDVLSSINEYKYDSNSNMTYYSSIDYNDDGTEEDSYLRETEYDEYGNEISFITKRSGSQTERGEYEYIAIVKSLQWLQS